MVKMMSPTPLQELLNLRWYIPHLINESGYPYDNDQSNYSPSEDKWMLQTHGKFIKYVLLTLHRITHEQMKMNPIKPIIKVKTNEKLDTEEEESNTVEQASTISNKEEEEYSTFLDMSKRNSESDINIDDTSEDKNINEIETIEHYGEKIHETEESMSTETSQVPTIFNKAIHHEDDSQMSNL